MANSKEALRIISLFVLAVVFLSSGDVFYEKKLELEPRQDAIFNFTTLDRKPIFATEFGLKGKGQDLKNKFIVVTKFHGIECGKDFNYSEGRRYRNRVYFIGNITIGQAWFKITNVDENDTNVYQVGIREETGRPKYKKYSVELVVERKNESLPSTSPVTKQQAKKEQLETKKPTGILTSDKTNAPSTKATVKIKGEPIEDSSEPEPLQEYLWSM